MKHPPILTFFVFTLLVSCKPEPLPLFSPTQNGFGVMVKGIGVDSGPGAKLCYKGTNTTPVLVWPTIGTAGDPILYTNYIALMLATKPDEKGRMGGSAIIAVQGRGPAMDISNDVLKIAAEQARLDFKKALRVCWPSVLTLLQGNKLEIIYGSNLVAEPTIPKVVVQITWDQIFEIMQDVKRTGKTNKVTNTEVMYLQKDYGVD